MPLLGDEGHRELISFLTSVSERWEPPRAILVVSAHWEESVPTLLSATNPGLLYDYYGFPAPAYEISYPAPGAPELAAHIAELLSPAGFHPAVDDNRGFDHGMFVPLALMFPDASIPCLQLSLIRGLNPGEHLRLGRALERLRDEGVLILGSGMSYHNLQSLMNPDGSAEARNQGFHQWLVELCVSEKLSSGEREAGLASWESAPHARDCHPREEHLLPLHVCMGAAGAAPATEVFAGTVMGRRVTALSWE